MLIVCKKDWGFSFQLCGVKQEQDLFLGFSIKKPVDSLEKVAIVPILDMLAMLRRCLNRIFEEKMGQHSRI
ncbi:MULTISPECIES: hypothetical protein [Vibrio]|uniref:hypothetical protein n=1 Tax=Vibrio TaxID=662 RepID=UPI0006CA8126|nr:MULTISPECIES: hypothetical protein [Vibrio]KPM90309.1 hypothetical protein AOR09_04790 [Vibrio alginolyticus]KPM99204.1 hypothetical protein AOG25_07175 [Vibrio alginolyticus]MCR9346627.1 hypothetical protein [Vibrio alginolyticus]MCR9417761.1 hypothetical protein [Vibrio alginolyticus]MCR9505985.1 hypothetical protein [Vibrio alginolyticus]